MSEEPTKTLEDLQPGDEIVVWPAHASDRLRIQKIDRITKTQIVIGNLKFRRDSGRQVGSHDCWHFFSVSVPTAELRDQARVEKKKARVNNILTLLQRRYSKLPEDSLDRILELRDIVLET